MQNLSVAQKALTEHWETWITADDFASMKDAGLNHVRYVSILIHSVWLGRSTPEKAKRRETASTPEAQYI